MSAKEKATAPPVPPQAVRVWKDCPECEGLGVGRYHDAGCPCASTRPAVCTCGRENLCVPCKHHFAALDAAVKGEREAHARIVKGVEGLERAMRDLPDDVRLEARDWAAQITVGQAIEDMREGLAAIRARGEGT